MSDYYENSFQAYHEKTFSIDPTFFLEPFVERLVQGSLILDVGCGSGRDLLWMKRQGFRVVGFERSEGLARLARKNADCEVIEGDFETYDFSKLKVDAILLSGALVHVPHDKLEGVFQRISLALTSEHPYELSGISHKPKADLYISLKEGSGTHTDDHGRTFYLWQDDALRELFGKKHFTVLDFSISESVIRASDVWLGYVLTRSDR